MKNIKFLYQISPNQTQHQFSKISALQDNINIDILPFYLIPKETVPVRGTAYINNENPNKEGIDQGYKNKAWGRNHSLAVYLK